MMAFIQSGRRIAVIVAVGCLVWGVAGACYGQEANVPPAGFTALFNGTDLSGWVGRGHFDPRQWWAMSPSERKAKQEADNADMAKHWRVENGEIINDGHGVFLTTVREFGDFELIVDWKMMSPGGDSGIYLRGVPQVQIWDPANEKEFKNGADKGSGALWNNAGKGKFPLVKADNPIGQWNRFRIIMIGPEVTIWFNDKLVVHEAKLDNFFDRNSPMFPVGVIQLQTHGSEMRFRNVFIREIKRYEPEGGVFSKQLKPVGDGWKALVGEGELGGLEGESSVWAVDKHVLRGTAPGDNKPHYIYTRDEYGDFELHALVKLTGEGHNGGIFFRAEKQGETGIKALELDAGVDVWGMLQDVGGDGNVTKPTKAQIDEALSPDGWWRHYYMIARGGRIEAWLNGVKVIDANHPRGPRNGKIALQVFRGVAEFQELHVRPIGPDSHLTFTPPAPGEEGFTNVFNGQNLDGWVGATDGYAAEDGKLVCLKEKGGNLYLKDKYGDFVMRFEFRLFPGGANNGLGIRAEQGKDAAYHGMELQILDNTAPVYAGLAPYQYHGSVYGVAPALRGYQLPLGEWNYQEVTAKGNQITVKLNGKTIVDVDIEKVGKPKTIDGHDHPGLFNKDGYIGFLGHGHRIEARNIRIKRLD